MNVVNIRADYEIMRLVILRVCHSGCPSVCLCVCVHDDSSSSPRVIHKRQEGGALLQKLPHWRRYALSQAPSSFKLWMERSQSSQMIPC